jgi:hypothetical protein
LNTLNNTFIGKGAGIYNTTGSNNTANGVNSLYSNTTGTNNTANGVNSLYSNTAGNSNTANGIYSLYLNTTGAQNTANGLQSLYSNTAGYYNTANGVYSLYANNTGNFNTANGYASLYSNTAGYGNTANGAYSFYANNTGTYNTALGFNSGRYIADGITGRTTGSNGLYLGYNSKASANGTDNEIVIGYNAIGAGSNSVVLGNTNITKTILNGNVGIGTITPSEKLDVNGNVILSYGYSIRGRNSINNPVTLVELGTGTWSPVTSGGVNLYRAGFSNTNGFELGDAMSGIAAGGATFNRQILFYTNTYERMRIDKDGNLGLSVAPSANFQVAQSTIGGGTVTTNGTTALVGTGTKFTNTFKVGDTITVSGETVRTIATITDNTNLTTTVALSTTASTLAYTLTGGTRFSVLGNGNVGIGTTNPTSKLQVNGSFSSAYIAKTANYTLTLNDYTVDCTTGTFTITLPTAIGITGRIYNVKNTGTGVITVDGDGTETIDGELTISLYQWDSITIQSTNTGWIII